MNIELSYPGWYVLLCVLVGVLYAFVLYRKEQLLNEVNKVVVYAMAFFRFCVVTLLAFLLLEPLVQTENQVVEKPVLVLAQDNSTSLLLNKDSVKMKGDYLLQLQQFKEKLEEKYEVKTYTFGDEVKSGLEVDYSSKQTDISELFGELYTRYYGRNLGAVVLATDGIVNRGSDPLYAFSKLKHSSVFTVALGDTTIRKDLIISNVVANRLAYKGNDFPVEITVKANQLKGEKATVQISRGGTNWYTQEIDFATGADVITLPVLLEAKESGKQKFTVTISELEGELTYVNNKREFYIDILDNKQEILILASAPHPDIAALRGAMEKNVNYEVEVALTDKFDGNFEPYSLVVFHQLASYNGREGKWVEQAISEKVPGLFLIGVNTQFAGFNKQELGLSVIGPNGGTDVTASLNTSFTQFSVSEELKQLIPKFPPLKIPFAGDYKISGGTNVLMQQTVGATQTDFPLIMFNEKESVKYGVILGEGLWRWKLYEYQTTQSNNLFNDLVSKMVQYLAAKEDKSQFRVYCENNVLENESVVFEAELYNDSYELTNDPEVTIEITNESGETYPAKSFSKSGNAYRLDAGNFDVGSYTYTANVTLGTKNFEESGEFTVHELKMEYSNVMADHSMLYNLAQSTGGEMYYPDQLDQLADAIFNKEDIVDISYTQKDVTDLINWKWIFALLMALLSVEWFLRKRNGAY